MTEGEEEMEKKRQFEKYYARIRKEGIIRSVIFGFIIGFAASLVGGILSYLAALVSGILICLGVGIVVGGVASVIFYFSKFRPTTKMIAERIDRLGLEERLITMMELEKDESYIAMRQREDAQRKLNQVSYSQIRFAISRASIIAVTVLGVLAMSAGTLSTLGASGLLPWTPPKVIGRDIKEQYVEIVYEASEGGYLEGETVDAEENGYGQISIQIVEVGKSTSVVMTVAMEGYMFYEWDDGSTDVERIDSEVVEDKTYVALFIPLEFAEGDPNGDEVEGEAEGQGDKAGVGDEPIEGEAPGGEGPTSADGPPSEGAGGKSEPVDQIKDGNTYYRDEYDYYYNEAKELLMSGNLTEEERIMLETYYGILV